MYYYCFLSAHCSFKTVISGNHIYIYIYFDLYSLRIFLYYKTLFTFHLVTALANKKFPEDDDCATYGRLTSDIFSVQSRALTSASDYLSNQDASIISNTSNPEPSLEEKMWSAMALDSPTQPLPLVQKRENFFY